MVLKKTCKQKGNYYPSVTLTRATGPQGSLGIPRKPYVYLFFEICLGIFGNLGQLLRFLIKITWFLSFSNKNDAESLCHFVKNLILDPKRVKFDQNSDFCHVRTFSWLHKVNPRKTVGKPIFLSGFLGLFSDFWSNS